MWIERNIQNQVIELSGKFPALVLTGARQTGKTSLLRRIFPQYSYVSLDLADAAELAEKSPEEFLSRFPPPVVIDEVQYAPGLFRNLKIAIDKDRHGMGRFILTGSQSFASMKEISESLAGRCVVMQLESLCANEIAAGCELKPDYPFLLQLLSRGTFPELWRDRDIPHESFYQSYLLTYLERDLRQIINVSRLRDFERFLRCCAVRTGQLLNQAELARDVGISPMTAAAWISALQAGNILVLLEPYFADLGKRLIKSPKLYFSETGLLCFLLGLNGEGLERTPLVGQIWENFIFAELRRHLHLASPAGRIYFYRDQQAREVDFVIEQCGSLSLLEAKWSERVDSSDARTIRQIAALMAKAKPHPQKVAGQAVICRTPLEHPIDDNIEVVNWFNISRFISPL
jgi:predicted AAA+ superfamily ATPase